LSTDKLDIDSNKTVTKGNRTVTFPRGNKTPTPI
jgi:hypothetical protein